MKPRHQADLVWMFQHAKGEIDSLAGEARLAARDRMERIASVIFRLPTWPVLSSHALIHRYRRDESVPEIRLVFRENAGLAAITRAATTYCARVTGDPLPRHEDLNAWLAGLCRRITRREASAADTVALDDIRREAETWLADAERAYERIAEGPAWSFRDEVPPPKPPKPLKAFYTVPELARALGMSRWTVRRWLDENRIPYELRRREGATSRGRIIVLLSELRTYAPSYFSSIRGGLEAGDEASEP